MLAKLLGEKNRKYNELITPITKYYLIQTTNSIV